MRITFDPLSDSYHPLILTTTPEAEFDTCEKVERPRGSFSFATNGKEGTVVSIFFFF